MFKIFFKYKYFIFFILLLLTGVYIVKTLYFKSVLVCISSKSPNPKLYECIEALYKIQMKDNYFYTICVVDSDSTDLREYDRVKKDFPNVNIHLVKNKNYEYGAWKFAQTVYPNYDLYFCIQDVIIVHNHIDLRIVNNKTAYTFHDYSGYDSHLSIKEKGIDNIKGSGLLYQSIIDKKFTLAQHSSFIVNSKVMKDIFKTLQIPPVDKDGSCFYERNFSIYFILKRINTINLYDYMSKTSGNRK